MRGRASQSLQNHLKHALNMYQRIIVPETQHAIAHSLQISCASLVVHHLIRVLTTVQLDDQHSFRADEIDDVVADLVLAAEFEA